MKMNRPAVLINRKRTVIALRLIMTLAVASQTLSELSTVSAPSLAILVV